MSAYIFKLKKSTKYPYLENVIHDMAHCTGLNCPVRENCKRYHAHIALKKDCKNIPYAYYINAEYYNGRCDFFIEL